MRLNVNAKREHREHLFERFPRRLPMPPAEVYRSIDSNVSPDAKLARHIGNALGIKPPHPNDWLLAPADYKALMAEVERWMKHHAVLHGPGGVARRGRDLSREERRKALAWWSLGNGPVEDFHRVGIEAGTIYVREPEEGANHGA